MEIERKKIENKCNNVFTFLNGRPAITAVLRWVDDEVPQREPEPVVLPLDLDVARTGAGVRPQPRARGVARLPPVRVGPHAGQARHPPARPAPAQPQQTRGIFLKIKMIK